jgi:putative PIN family toxin of toxin-antitoxin system
MKRIILDTNLWVSFLITGNYDKLDSLLFEHHCQINFSNELLREFVEVVRRPKLRKYFTLEELTDLLEIIEDYSEMVEVRTPVELCRDTKDNFLLSLGIDGKADYLITGDKDLLVLESVDNLRICTISDFLATFQ